MVNKKALNIELLKFAGFTYTEGGWSYPDGTDVGNCVPFFPESLDECFKWIIRPKLLGYSLFSQGGKHVATAIPFKPVGDLDFGVCDNGETPAIAFCLAVKELINAKE